jgi:hypothetical protein
MKRTILTTLLLASSLAFGQKFQDISAKGSPLSLSVKIDSTDHESYVVAHNNSRKGVLALVAVGKASDAKGQVDVHWSAQQDYVFKHGVIASQEEREVAPMEDPQPGDKITQATGAVLFVQFEDGSTWGDPEAGKQMLATRPRRLAFLQHLVEIYYRDGDAALAAALDDRTNFGRPESSVAGCLKVDAEAEKIAAIDLAKKRLADAQEWRALGIF